MECYRYISKFLYGFTRTCIRFKSTTTIVEQTALKSYIFNCSILYYAAENWFSNVPQRYSYKIMEIAKNTPGRKTYSFRAHTLVSLIKRVLCYSIRVKHKNKKNLGLLEREEVRKINGEPALLLAIGNMLVCSVERREEFF